MVAPARLVAGETYSTVKSYAAVHLVLDSVVTVEVAVNVAAAPSAAFHVRPLSVAATIAFWIPQIVGG